MPAKRGGKGPSGAGGAASGSALGFEATLWATADKLRGTLDAAEYKHVAPGLILQGQNIERFLDETAEPSDELALKDSDGFLAEINRGQNGESRPFHTQAE
jgi:type I restriction enzyme M protein